MTQERFLDGTWTALDGFAIDVTTSGTSRFFRGHLVAFRGYKPQALTLRCKRVLAFRFDCSWMVNTGLTWDYLPGTFFTTPESLGDKVSYRDSAVLNLASFEDCLTFEFLDPGSVCIAGLEVGFI